MDTPVNWIAVTGRQKLNAYFESKPAMNASATAMLVSARMRAACHSVRACDESVSRAMRFHVVGDSSYQKFAIRDWSGVRTELSARPRAFTSA